MPKTYKIGEAAALLNLKTYVLRFWETEFPEIVPLRTEKGQRIYAEEHIALLERIRYLLHDRGLTIGGARKALEEERERGVVYAFGVPGAIARDQARPARQPAPEEDAFEPEEDDDGVEETTLPYMDYTRDHVPGPRPLVRRKGQCNLPGIEEPASMYDESAAEQAGAEGPASSETQGMLPLFSVVKSAYLVGQASGRAAGENFIKATAPDAPPGKTPSFATSAAHATHEGALVSGAAAPPAFSPGLTREILRELEAIERILTATVAPRPQASHLENADFLFSDSSDNS